MEEPVPKQVTKDQSVKLREEIAKEYEEKYQASLEEVDRYKEQLETHLRDAEKR